MLVKIPLRVHETNRYERQTEVAGLFQMISGEKTKPSRIKGE